MYQPVTLYISLRYIRGNTSGFFNHFISWLSTISITLGVTALIIVSSVMNGFECELKKNILEVIPQALLTTAKEQLNPKDIPSSVLNSIHGITHIEPLTTGDVILQSVHSIAIGVMLGINPKNSIEPLKRYILGAKLDDLIVGQYRVILGDKLAAVLGVHYGDMIRLITFKVNQFTPVGRIPSQRLFKVIGIFTTNSEADSYQLIVNQQDASCLMHYPKGCITGWRLWLQEPLKVDVLSKQHLSHCLVWKDWRESKGELFQAMRMEKNMMFLLLSLIIITASFNIITSLGFLVIKKTAEIAILKTQGLNRRQIMLIFIMQGSSFGIIGALFGTIFGVLLSSKLNYLMLALKIIPESNILPVSIEPLNIVVIALLAVIISIISTLYPSWKAADINPSEVLRYE